MLVSNGNISFEISAIIGISIGSTYCTSNFSGTANILSNNTESVFNINWLFSKNAIKDFDYAINIDNNYKQAYYNRANLLLQLGYNDEALAELNRLVKIDPRDAFAYNTIGVILISQHKYKESIRYYDKVLSLDKSLTAVYYNRAYANYKLNNFDACISDYTKLLNSKVKLSDFEKAQAYHFRSSCNSQSHKAVSAVNDLSNAARLYKKIGETEYYNGIIEILKDAGYDTSEL